MNISGLVSFLKSCFSKRCGYLIFFVTSKCNASCAHCFYHKKLNSGIKELTLEEIEKISRGFKNLPFLSLTGGEPVLRDDLSSIISLFYKNSRTRFATFSTNGLLAEKIENTVKEILKECPSLNLKVYISIDAFGGKHDKIRGVGRIFEKALLTFSKLKSLKKTRKNLSVFIETVLSSYNKDDITRIIDFVNDEMKPDGHTISLIRGAAKEKEALKVSISDYKKAADYLKQKQPAFFNPVKSVLELMTETNTAVLKEKKATYLCLAGIRTLTIKEDGKVLPCEMLEQKFSDKSFIMGDLRENNYDINNVINSRQAKKILKFINDSNCFCTFECAALCNIVYNYKTYPKILLKALK